MKKYHLVSEDHSSYVLHDGEKPFHIAKHPLDQGMHKKIRELPKYAVGGEVEEGGDGDTVEPAAEPSFMDNFVNYTNGLVNGANEATAPAVNRGNETANLESAKAYPETASGAEVVERQPAVAEMPQTDTTPQVQTPQPSPLSANMNGIYKDMLGAQNQAIQGIQAGATAQGQMGNEVAGAYQKAMEDQKKAFDDSVVRRKALDDEAHSIQQAMAAQKLDPNRLWHNSSTGSKIGAAIAMIFSGIGAGMSGGQNMAMQVIQKKIDQDIDAQKNDQSKTMNLYKFNRDRYQNELMADQATRLQMNAALQGQIAAISAKYTGPVAQAQAQQAMGMLKVQQDQLKMQMQQHMYQTDMARRMMGGDGGQAVDPAKKIAALSMMKVIPQGMEPQVYKELKDAQNLKQLHDEGMHVFDEVAKLNTVAGKLNPQTQSKIAAIRDAYLDKLTKDTSGRVTPETVKLVEGIFSGATDSKATIDEKRKNFHNFLLSQSSFPMLDTYGVNPIQTTKFYTTPAAKIPRAK